MGIWTTYLGFLNKHGGADKVAQRLGSCFVYYVARDRGNNVVAPPKWLLDDYKAGRTTWETYQHKYQLMLEYNLEHRTDAYQWMEKRAQEAKTGNILLVCYEKNPEHCHRRLLAEEIARRFGVEYKGELEEPAHIYSLDGKPDKFDYQ